MLWLFVKNHPIPFRKAASSHFIQLLFPLLRTSFQKGALADKPEQFPSELETNAFIIWEKTRLIAWFPVLGTPWSAFPYVCVLCMFGQLLLLRVQYVLEFLHQNHENWLNPFYRVWVSSSFKLSSSNMYQASSLTFAQVFCVWAREIRIFQGFLYSILVEFELWGLKLVEYLSLE